MEDIMRRIDELLAEWNEIRKGAGVSRYMRLLRKAMTLLKEIRNSMDLYI